MTDWIQRILIEHESLALDSYMDRAILHDAIHEATRLEIARLDTLVADLREQLADAHRSLYSARHELAVRTPSAIEAQLDEAHAEIDRLRGELLRATGELTTAEHDLNVTRNHLRIANTKIDMTNQVGDAIIARLVDFELVLNAAREACDIAYGAIEDNAARMPTVMSQRIDDLRALISTVDKTGKKE